MHSSRLLLLLTALLAAALGLPRPAVGETERDGAEKALRPQQKAQHFSEKALPLSDKSASTFRPDSSATQTDSTTFLLDSARIGLVVAADSAHAPTPPAPDSLLRARADSLLHAQLLQADTLWGDTALTVLKEFTVKARQPDVINRGDTLIFNAENFQLPAHAKLRDLLRLLPGVQVQKDGTVLVNGRALTSLYIEGRYFRLADLDQAIDMLPSNIVSRLKVYDRPSREEELTGISTSPGETVLDLSVKDDMKALLQADAELHGGRDFGRRGKMRDGGSLQTFALDHGNSYTGRIGWERKPYETQRNAQKNWDAYLGADYKFSDKFNLTANANASHTDNIDRFRTDTRTFLADSSQLVEQAQGNVHFSSADYGLYLRSEWKPNERNSVMVDAQFSYGLSDMSNSYSFLSQNAAGDTLNQGSSSYFTHTRNYRLNTTVAHSLRMRKEGRVLYSQLSLVYGRSPGEGSNEWRRREYEQGIYSRDSLQHSRSRQLNLNRNVRLYLSWVEPFGKRHKLQVAVTAQLTSDRSNSTYYETLPSGRLRLSIPLSNESQRRENSQEVRLFWRSVWKRYEHNIGINFERIDSRTRDFAPTTLQAAGDYAGETAPTGLPCTRGDSLISSVEQDNLSFSPLFNFTWRLPGDRTLTGAYNGNLSAPQAYQLREYVDVSSPQNTVQGNPNLKPTFHHSFNLTYNGTGLSKKGYQYASFSGNLTTNEIKTVYDIDMNTGHRYTTYRNVNGNYTLNGNYSLTQPLDKGEQWNLSLSLGANYRHTRAYTNGQFSTLRPYSLSVRPGVYFHRKEWNVSLYGSFRYERSQTAATTDAIRHQKDWSVQATLYGPLPGKIYLDTDFNWTLRRGYGDGADYGRAIWNLKLTRELFKVAAGTASLTLGAYDFLPGTLPVMRSTVDNVQSDSYSDYRASYLMATFRFHFEHQLGNKGGSAD